MIEHPESDFPTIRDLHAVAAGLIEQGFGDLPVQIIVAPDSTLQAIARAAGAKDDSKPAIMAEFDGRDGRLPVSMISADRLANLGPRDAVQ